MKHALKQEYQKNLIILLHRCVCFTLATFLLHKFCSVNVVRSMHKTFYELNRKPSSEQNILTQLNMAEERLAEAVRKYPVLYDKSDKYFKARTKTIGLGEQNTLSPSFLKYFSHPHSLNIFCLQLLSPTYSAF